MMPSWFSAESTNQTEGFKKMNILPQDLTMPNACVIFIVVPISNI